MHRNVVSSEAQQGHRLLSWHFRMPNWGKQFHEQWQIICIIMPLASINFNIHLLLQAHKIRKTLSTEMELSCVWSNYSWYEVIVHILRQTLLAFNGELTILSGFTVHLVKQSCQSIAIGRTLERVVKDNASGSGFQRLVSPTMLSLYIATKLWRNQWNNSLKKLEALVQSFPYGTPLNIAVLGTKNSTREPRDFLFRTIIIMKASILYAMLEVRIILCI